MTDHGQNKNELLQRLEELERRHKTDLQTIDLQKHRIAELKSQLSRVKHNASKLNLNETVSSSTLHGFYNDVFITDLQKQVDSQQKEVETYRVESMQMANKLEAAKYDKIKMRSTLKRYRKFLAQSNMPYTTPSNLSIEDKSAFSGGLQQEIDRSNIEDSPVLKGLGRSKHDAVNMQSLSDTSKRMAKVGYTIKNICSLIVSDGRHVGG